MSEILMTRVLNLILTFISYVIYLLSGEHQLSSIEKQEAESPEKSHRSRECACSTSSIPVSSQALLDRVQAQQRRIAALEVAEKVCLKTMSMFSK